MSNRKELKWSDTALPGPAQSLVGYDNTGNPVDVTGVKWDSVLDLLKITGSFQVQFTDKVKLLIKRGFNVTAAAFDQNILLGPDVPNNSVITAFGFIQGIREDDGSEAFGGAISAVFQKDAAGTVVQVGATQSTIPLQENQAIGAPILRFQVFNPTITIGFTNPGGGSNYVASAFCVFQITSK